ncbi:MAG: hypothetical protein ACYDH3_00690 [Candidatus Aminicenantales bacterium]
MKKNKPLILIGLAVLVLLTAGLVPVLAGTQDTGKGRGRDIHIGPEAEQQQLVAWGGTVTIEGKIRKDVLIAGGNVTISGEIGDTFIGIGTHLILKPTAVIRKDLVLFGGTLEREDGSTVKGDTVFFKAKGLKLDSPVGGFRSFFGFSLLPVILIVKIVSLFLWILFVAVVIGLFPKNVTLAAGELRRSLGPVILTGIIAAAAFTFLMIFAALLSIILIGLPILIGLAFAAIAIKVFGRVVVYYVAGQITAEAFHKSGYSPMAGAMIGLAVVSFIGFIPVLGGLFSFFLSLLAWGIALRTKFGTTGNWFRKTPPVSSAPTPAPPAPQP